MCFVGSFLIAWDIWIVPSEYQPSVILYCVGISLLVGIVVTVPIGFIMKITQNLIRERNRQKELEKNEKDFLDQ